MPSGARRTTTAAPAITALTTAGRKPMYISRVRSTLTDDSSLRQVLHDYFAWATTTTMSRYHHSADNMP